MRQGSLILVLVLLLGLAGCKPGGEANAAEAPDTKAAAKAVAQQFGQAILAGDWQKAHGMLTAEAQAAKPAPTLQSEYETALAEMRKLSNGFTPNMVEAATGSLPTDEKEAAETYGIKNPPPKSTWRGWVFAQVGIGEDGILDQGIAARLLVVHQGKGLQVAHVEYGMAD